MCCLDSVKFCFQTQHTFKKLYDEKTSQKVLFDSVALPLVDDLVHGKNGESQVLQYSTVIFFTVVPICNLHHIRAHTGPGKPGKSWNFLVAFSRTGKSWKKVTGSGKFWKSVKL